MNVESSQSKVTHKLSAAIAGQFTGSVSNFNQFVIIGSIVLTFLIFGFAHLSLKNANIFLPILYFFIFIFCIFLIFCFCRHCRVKPADEIYPITTKVMALDRSLEIQNAPQSLITQELLSYITALRFFQNEPPMGIIEGKITDKSSIKMLNEEERMRMKQEEEKKIIEHQNAIVKQLETLKASVIINSPEVIVDHPSSVIPEK